MRAIALGILASLFFAVTFVLNRSMDLAGGSWIWSSVLRYVFMMPPLLLLVTLKGNLKPLFSEMARHPLAWLGWSTVGFGIFYAPLCFSAAYGPAWLVAGTWQITIIAGSLLPLFGQRQGGGEISGVGKVLPLKSLAFSGIILLGIGLIQLPYTESLSFTEIALGIGPVLVAAFAYPLGNRRMMALVGSRIDTYQRVLGMTLASLPFWLILSVLGLADSGLPSMGQTLQSLVVALSSGVIATIMFFKATDLSKSDAHQLAAVEATQSGEVIFALIGELLFLGGLQPSPLSFAGLTLVIIGMILHSLLSRR